MSFDPRTTMPRSVGAAIAAARFVSGPPRARPIARPAAVVHAAEHRPGARGGSGAFTGAHCPRPAPAVLGGRAARRFTPTDLDDFRAVSIGASGGLP